MKLEKTIHTNITDNAADIVKEVELLRREVYKTSQVNIHKSH